MRRLKSALIHLPRAWGARLLGLRRRALLKGGNLRGGIGLLCRRKQRLLIVVEAKRAGSGLRLGGELGDLYGLLKRRARDTKFASSLIDAGWLSVPLAVRALLSLNRPNFGRLKITLPRFDALNPSRL